MPKGQLIPRGALPMRGRWAHCGGSAQVWALPRTPSPPSRGPAALLPTQPHAGELPMPAGCSPRATVGQVRGAHRQREPRREEAVLRNRGVASLPAAALQEQLRFLGRGSCSTSSRRPCASARHTSSPRCPRAALSRWDEDLGPPQPGHPLHLPSLQGPACRPSPLCMAQLFARQEAVAPNAPRLAGSRGEDGALPRHPEAPVAADGSWGAWGARHRSMLSALQAARTSAHSTRNRCGS